MELRRCLFCISLYSEDNHWWSCVKAGLGEVDYTWREITSMKGAPNTAGCDFKLNPLVQYVASRRQHRTIAIALKEEVIDTA